MLGFRRPSPHIRPPRTVHTFDSLRNPAFRTFWISMVFQWTAFNMRMVANGWFMYELTDSPFLLGLSGAASGLPMFALSFLGGVIADRVDKRQLQMAGTLGQGLAAAAIALLITFDAIVWWHLLIASAVQGVMFALTVPGRQSAVPQLVGKDQIVNALSLNTAGMNVAGLVAPAIAGFLVVFVDVMGVYWIIAGLLVVSASVMLWVPPLPPEQNRHAKNVFKDMVEGLRFVRKDAVLVLLLVVTFVAVALGTPLNTLMPVFAESILKVGPSGLGMLQSMMGLGALIGSLAMASLGDFRHKGVALLLLTLLWGGSIVGFTATSVYPLALFLMVPVGMGQSARNVIVNTVMLTRSPPDVRGRVISLNMMTWGLQPLGLLPIGAAAEVIGAPYAIGIGGAIVAALAVVFIVFSPTLRRL